MNNYRFILEPYVSLANRTDCPNCSHKKVFARFIDRVTGERLPELYGKCNREEKCGYFFNPYSDGFAKSIENVGNVVNVGALQTYTANKNFGKGFKSATQCTLPTLSSAVPKAIFNESTRGGTSSHFSTYLCSLFGDRISQEVLKQYHIGTSNHWPGDTIFWQVDTKLTVRGGKVMLYSPTTGKRVKEPFNHITWAHKVFTIENYSINQCFFGEHLLSMESKKPVAIVESEKTAIIASIYMPRLLWLAAGSKNGLTAKKCEVLRFRKVILWPDVNAYSDWKRRADDFGFAISDFLEKNASSDQKAQGCDLADFLVKRDASGFAVNDQGYPIMWDV